MSRFFLSVQSGVQFTVQSRVQTVFGHSVAGQHACKEAPMPQFLDRLQDEWQSLAHSSRAAQALDGWSSDPALAGFSGLEEVVAAIQQRGRPEESDRILLALLRRAAVDNLAARTILQALLPGLKTLMSAYRLTGEPEEVATAVIEAAFERIRRYPCDRRPARVAANLLHDTRQSLWRDACRERRLRVATEPLTEAAVSGPVVGTPERSATDELVDLVAEAVRLGRVRRCRARLILLTRVLDVHVEELAKETGTKPVTLRKRRQRAEAILAAVAA
jgi:DNA-directed RNA polymerase specialized sigma24 family protein